ncbi:MAG TPA: folate-binding protein [Candidatus Angelobacter sp.]
MGNTALQQRPASPPARLGVYNGVETTLDYGDPAGELATLRSQCGVFELSWRTKITVAGKDRVRWLHNMVTNNVRDLALNRGAYNFVLNAQGRILGDIYVYNRAESLLLDTDRAQAEPLLAAMKRFIIMDKVEMSLAGEIGSLGLCGPRSGDALAAAGLDATGLEPLEIRQQKLGDLNISLVRGPQNKPGWYELWTDNVSATPVVRERLAAAGAIPVGAEALELWRVLHGIPHYGQDIRDRDLPQETGQPQALSFTKGCYIGQEIVERIRSRGQVHRKFTGFEFLGDPPPLGKYDSGGRTVAEITSLANIPAAEGEKKLGLGYIRREAAEAGPEVDLGGHKARIVELPFAI